MIAVDTSAVMAILQAEPEEDRLIQIMNGTDCCFPASVIVETSILSVSRGLQGDLQEFSHALSAVVISLDGTIAQQAVEAYVRYGKGRHKAGLNFGDCLVYATAQHLNVPLLCKGNDFVHTDIRLASI